MGSRLYLPMDRPYPRPSNEREELLNRLFETKTLLPDARTMEIEQLREYVQAQEAKQRSGYYDRVAPTQDQAPMTPEEAREVRQALKEIIAWRRRRRNSPLSRRFY